MSNVDNPYYDPKLFDEDELGRKIAEAIDEMMLERIKTGEEVEMNLDFQKLGPADKMFLDFMIPHYLIRQRSEVANPMLKLRPFSLIEEGLGVTEYEILSVGLEVKDSTVGAINNNNNALQREEKST